MNFSNSILALGCRVASPPGGWGKSFCSRSRRSLRSLGRAASGASLTLTVASNTKTPTGSFTGPGPSQTLPSAAFRPFPRCPGGPASPPAIIPRRRALIAGRRAAVAGCPASAAGHPAVIAGHPAIIHGRPATMAGCLAVIAGRPPAVAGCLAVFAGCPARIAGCPARCARRRAAIAGHGAVVGRRRWVTAIRRP